MVSSAVFSLYLNDYIIIVIFKALDALLYNYATK